ncbi:TPA: acyltransferase family protein [Streptococcus suis]|nr:acyltransferase family protein [Streptococcus suis]
MRTEQNRTEQLKNGNDTIDLVKLLMAVGVVGIHSGLVGLKTFGRLGVPFFLITGSYFFFSKYDFISNNYLKKYLKRIFLLYFSWQLLFTPLFIMQFVEDLHGNHSISNVLFQLLEFVTYARHNGWGQSWYLLAVLYGLPVLIFLIKRLPIRVLSMLFIVTEFYFIFTQGYNMLLPSDTLIISPLTTLRALPYLFLGYLLVLQNKKIKTVDNRKYTYIMILLLFLFIFENISIDRFFDGITNAEEIFLTMPTALVVFIWSITSKLKFKFALFFRNFSTFLYVIHKAIISFIVRLSSLEQEIEIFLLTVSVSLVLYYIYLWFKKKFNWRWLNYLI